MPKITHSSFSRAAAAAAHAADVTRAAHAVDTTTSRVARERLASGSLAKRFRSDKEEEEDSIEEWVSSTSESETDSDVSVPRSQTLLAKAIEDNNTRKVARLIIAGNIQRLAIRTPDLVTNADTPLEKRYHSPFTFAALCGHLDSVKKIEELMEEEDQKKEAPLALQLAIANGHPLVVEFLLSKGVSADHRKHTIFVDEAGSYLIKAVALLETKPKEAIAILKILTRYGAPFSLDIANEVFLAIEFFCKIETVCDILETLKESDTSLPPGDYFDPFFATLVLTHNKASLSTLLALKVFDPKKALLVVYATYRKSKEHYAITEEMLDDLLDIGADLDMTFIPEERSLTAAFSDSISCSEEDLSDDGDDEAWNVAGETVYTAALQYKEWAIATWCKERGSDIDVVSPKDGKNALQRAVYFQDWERASLFIANGANCDLLNALFSAGIYAGKPYIAVPFISFATKLNSIKTQMVIDTHIKGKIQEEINRLKPIFDALCPYFLDNVESLKTHVRLALSEILSPYKQEHFAHLGWSTVAIVEACSKMLMESIHDSIFRRRKSALALWSVTWGSTYDSAFYKLFLENERKKAQIKRIGN